MFMGGKSSMHRICIQFAGCRVEFLTTSDLVYRKIQSSLSVYQTEKKNSEGGELPSAEILMEPYSTDIDTQVSIAESGFILNRLPNQEHETVERAAGWIDLQHEQGVSNLLKSFAPSLLLRGASFLLSGAAVLKNGKGYVFLGPKGAGKSTVLALISSLDPEVTILADELVILQNKGGAHGPVVHSAPFVGKYSRLMNPPMMAPLEKVYTLVQSDFHEISDLEAVLGAQEILKNRIFSGATDFNDEAVLSLAHRLSSQKPGLCQLKFKRDSDFWPLILGLEPSEEQSRSQDLGLEK